MICSETELKELESSPEIRMQLLKESIFIKSMRGHQSDYTGVLDSYERTRKEAGMEQENEE